jgi:hypothetical protein
MRTRRLVSLAFLATLVCACGGGSLTSPTATPPGAPSPTDYAGQFDSLWTTFDQNYSYFDYKQIDWNALRTEFRPRAASAGSETELVTILQQMLGRLHDQHVVLTSGAATLATYVPGFFVNWDAGIWQQYVGRGNPVGRGAATAAVLSGVPYISIASWATGRIATSDLDALVDRFRDADSLVVDVRMNGGGNDQIAFEFAGRFARGTTVVSYVKVRNGPGHTDFTGLQPRTVSPRGSFTVARPVQVLIGRMCASSNESFIAAMHEMPNVTLVGDTTAGATANPLTFSLAGGWSYTVSHWIEFTARMQGIEDHGIDPDVVVPASPGDFASGRDPVLDWALAHAGAPIATTRIR